MVKRIEREGEGQAMNKQHLYLGLLLIFSISLNSFATDLTQRPRVAVLGVYDLTRYGYNRDIESRLTELLFSLDRFELVERSYIDRILQEQALQISFATTNTIVEAGRIIGAQYGFIAQIDQINTVWKKDTYQAEVRLSIKCVDIETGKLIGNKQALGLGHNRVRNRAIDEAFDRAFTEDIDPAIKSWFRLGSEIIKRDGNLVYIALGQNRGVKKGSRYLVYEKENLGFGSDSIFLKEIGLIEIKNTSSEWAEGIVLKETGTIKKGDIVSEQVIENYRLIGLGGVGGVGSGIEISAIYYRPLSHMSMANITFEYLPNINNSIVSVEFLKEFPLLRSLSFFVGGGFGSAIGSQRDIYGRNIYSLAYFLDSKAFADLSFSDKLSLRIGGVYYLATPYSDWYIEEFKYRVPLDRVPIKDYNLSGLRFNVGISFAF